ncbi:ketopantoate reductase family protein [Paenibacillus riograndensis]|uniref:2-dehydropantoate 2-reductase n=1 Tax=Paenibacillus riograndensis SBR5 TaxID=1073571 RepID=A0A0E4HE82_9BACL|nr:2-dehydropantoate 2-reductase [Paenibacillus riograndensis]CQR57546.1 2-dehydropantoate 2-reductase [Paenibacillus riograndensis SBR5]
MKIDIIGAGSLGLLLAGKLIHAGAEVRLWCRSDEQAEELSRQGITISYEDGSLPLHLTGSSFRAGNIDKFAETVIRVPGDWTAIMLKQNAFHDTLPKILAPLRDARLYAVCFQNGNGHLELLQELLPQASVWVAVTTEAAKRKSLTEIIHAGTGETFIGKRRSINPAKGGLEEETAAISLTKALVAAGFRALMSKEVDTMIYRKLLFNAVINPLTAIWRIQNGELTASGERIQLMKELYREAASVYDACGIAYDADAWEGILEVCRATSGNTSSMLADVLASRATEIRWINGSIVAMADRAGIAAPLHRWICRLVEGMNVKER